MYAGHLDIVIGDGLGVDAIHYAPVTCASCRARRIVGDLNGDGIVDGHDLGMLLGLWGHCPGRAVDLNGDGEVNGNDLGVLLGAWTG